MNDQLQGEQEVEAMVKRCLDSVATKKQTLRQKREMLSNVLKNDSEYQKLDEAYRKARIARMSRKADLMRQEENAAVQASVNDLIREVKTEQLALSDWLRQYRDNTKSDTFEHTDGVMYMIRANFKVKKESKADRWLRKHREQEAKIPLPGITIDQKSSIGRGSAAPAA